MNKNLKVLLLAVLMVFEGSVVAQAILTQQDESQLISLLQFRPLREVVASLRGGVVDPPLFTKERELNPVANKTFPLFIKLLEAERNRAKAAEFSNDSYAHDLIGLYEYFEKYNSYVSLLLCDVTKRMLLEWAQQQVISTKNPERLRTTVAWLRRATLNPAHVKLLYGRGEVPDETRNEHSRAEDIVQLFEQLWRSHGFNSLRDVQSFVWEQASAKSDATSKLVAEYKPVLLGWRLLTAEFIRACFLEGTVEFFLRDGEIDKVDPKDVRYFKSIMPQKDARRYGFPAMAKDALYGSDILAFLGRNTVGFQPAFWMAPVFE
jgi:hypothetical protein